MVLVLLVMVEVSTLMIVCDRAIERRDVSKEWYQTAWTSDIANIEVHGRIS